MDRLSPPVRDSIYPEYVLPLSDIALGGECPVLCHHHLHRIDPQGMEQVFYCNGLWSSVHFSSTGKIYPDHGVSVLLRYQGTR